jgi:septum formation topological specificity factor MinE
MSSKKNVQETLQKISLLHDRNKTLEKQKTKEMKQMLQNVINRYKILDDTIKAQLGGNKKQTTRKVKKVTKKVTEKVTKKNKKKKLLKKNKK